MNTNTNTKLLQDIEEEIAWHRKQLEFFMQAAVDEEKALQEALKEKQKYLELQ